MAERTVSNKEGLKLRTGTKKVIYAGDPDAFKYDREEVGGKGFNLLRLYSAAQQTSRFTVPNFFIIPSNAKKTFRADLSERETIVNFHDEEVKRAFEGLKKPVIIRSSSPSEDGQASFAGIFKSFSDRNTYREFQAAATSIIESASDQRAEEYARRMGVELSKTMALIGQEQAVRPPMRGIIELEVDKPRAVIESVDLNGTSHRDVTDYEILDKFATSLQPNGTRSELITEGEFHYAAQSARVAKKWMSMQGIVQVEFCLYHAQLPIFVQIRELLAITPKSVEVDTSIPKGAPYIESDVCNGIAGDVVRPAYVTRSQGGFVKLLVETGQSFFLGLSDNAEDERWLRFKEHSKLETNHDFQLFREATIFDRYNGLEQILRYCNEAWRKGNSLFDQYILVCDKLDTTYAGMADLTTGKRAIITCNENENQTSHAMTISRDLGIVGMGAKGNITDMNYFFHRVETGDIVHIKSDGKKAVAYIEKKRGSNPYQNR
jgi:hypothetical protein